MTTQVDRAYGFRPVTKRGEPYCGSERAVIFDSGDATAAFVGSLVKFTGTSVLKDGKYYSVVTIASAGDSIAGAVTRFSPDNDTYLSYRPASTERLAYIPQDRDVLYSAQEDQDTSSLAVTSVGLNVDFTAESGDTVTGQSTMEIDSDTAATTNTLSLRLVEVQGIDGNTVGSGNYTQWLVSTNLDPYSNTTGV